VAWPDGKLTSFGVIYPPVPGVPGGGMAHAGVTPVSRGAEDAPEDVRSLRRMRWYRQTVVPDSEDSADQGPLNNEFP